MAVDRRTRAQAHANKARAEIAAIGEAGVQLVGNAFSPVLLLKGEPGPGDRAGGTLFSGRDGKALRAALMALGYEPQDWVGMATWGADGSTLDAGLVRRAVVTLDPDTVVVCDDDAAGVLREAFVDELCMLEDVGDAMLLADRLVQVAGMRVLSLGGFEVALVSDRQKQVMWARLKRIPPLGEPY